MKFLEKVFGRMYLVGVSRMKMTDSSYRRSILADLSKEAFFDQKELFRSFLIRLFSSLSVDSSMTETEW